MSAFSSRRRFLHTTSLGLAGIAFMRGRNADAVSDLSERAHKLLGGFTWFKQSGFRVREGDDVIYFDPYQLTETTHDADVVFISHSHGDHCDTSSLSRIVKESTTVVTEPESAEKVGALASNVITVAPGDTITVKGFKAEMVPSYNINKTNHPRSKNYLGFIVTLLDGRRIYHAGDTDRIPEMATFDCNVALLPCGGTFTMNAEEAAEAAVDVQPEVVVPMHYGAIVGSVRDAETVRDDLAGSSIELVIMEEGETVDTPPTKVRIWPLQ